MQIRKIARQVREVIQKECEEAIDEIAHDPSNLEGACGYASYGLYRMIPGSVFVIGIYEGLPHAWVEYQDKIIDITISQFGISRNVYIIKIGGKKAKKYRPIQKGRKAVIELAEWDYPTNWRKNLPRRLKRKLQRGKKDET